MKTGNYVPPLLKEVNLGTSRNLCEITLVCSNESYDASDDPKVETVESYGEEVGNW